ncbi:MAG TPA: hypothetical protein VI795_00010 [Patescibacteria group bacterium]|nr:hypothetical protein [Patescibacteria group bacterium]
MSNELLWRYKQDTLFGGKDMSTDQEILRIGMNASEVVSRIFDYYGIEQFSHTEYDPESTYPADGNDQTLLRDNWSGIDGIERLSEATRNKTIQKFDIEGAAISIHNILAIGSKVVVGGKTKQLQMLDFDFSEDEANMDEIKSLRLSQGVILRTDRSFHYYGLNLLNDDDWRKWINKLLFLKDTKKLFGTEYLELCLKRGYSALRIFGYEGTSKKKTPVVIAKI